MAPATSESLQTSHESICDGELLRSFPSGKINRDLVPLVAGNINFRIEKKPALYPQRPTITTGACGNTAPELAHDIQKTGLMFTAFSQRIFGDSEAGLAGLTFPLRHLKCGNGLPTANLLQLMIRDCTLNGACRLHGLVPATSEALWREKLQTVRLPEHQTLEGCHLMHAEQIVTRLMESSPELFNLVDHGKLLIALSHYDDGSGRVTYPRLITSRREGLGLDYYTLQQVVNGCDVSHLKDLNPALDSLHTLSVGNTRHVAQKKEQGSRPTRFIIDACADSRCAPGIIFSSAAWEIEALRGAGNFIDAQKVAAIRAACENALSSQAAVSAEDSLSPIVRIIELSHTHCGAIEKALRAEGKIEGFMADAPILGPVWGRLGSLAEIIKKSEDPFVPACVNAMEACVEILNFPSADGRRIRELRDQGKVQMIPAVHVLETGEVKFLDPVS